MYLYIMYTFIHIYLCVHTCVYVYVLHMYIYTCILACILLVCLYVYRYMCIYIYHHVCSYIFTYIYVCVCGYSRHFNFKFLTKNFKKHNVTIRQTSSTICHQNYSGTAQLMF